MSEPSMFYATSKDGRWLGREEKFQHKLQQSPAARISHITLFSQFFPPVMTVIEHISVIEHIKQTPT